MNQAEIRDWSNCTETQLEAWTVSGCIASGTRQKPNYPTHRVKAAWTKVGHMLGIWGSYIRDPQHFLTKNFLQVAFQCLQLEKFWLEGRERGKSSQPSCRKLSRKCSGERGMTDRQPCLSDSASPHIKYQEEKASSIGSWKCPCAFFVFDFCKCVSLIFKVCGCFKRKGKRGGQLWRQGGGQEDK